MEGDCWRVFVDITLGHLSTSLRLVSGFLWAMVNPLCVCACDCVSVCLYNQEAIAGQTPGSPAGIELSVPSALKAQWR